MGILRDVTDEVQARPGRTLKCEVCGTLVRAGQIHSAHLPVPHQTAEAIVVHERVEELP